MARWWDRWLKDVDNGVDREPPIVVFVAPPHAADGRPRRVPGRVAVRGRLAARPRTRARAARSTERRRQTGRTTDRTRSRSAGDVGWTAWLSCAGAPPWGQPLDQRPDEAFSLVYDWDPAARRSSRSSATRSSAHVSRSSAPVAYLVREALRRPSRRHVAARDARAAQPHASRLARSTPRPRTRTDLRRVARARGHVVGVRAGPPDPPRPRRHRLAERLAAARPGHADDRAGGLARSSCPSSTGRRRSRQPPTLPAAAPTADVGHGRRDLVGRARRRPRRRRAPSWPTRRGARRTRSHPRSWNATAAIVGVSTDDPGRAWVDASSSYVLAWPEATVSADVRSRIESDANAYRVRLEIDASENGEVRWSRRFDRRFPREPAVSSATAAVRPASAGRASSGSRAADRGPRGTDVRRERRRAPARASA